MKAKKVLAVIMAAAMTMGVMAGCGAADKTASEGATVAEGTKESVASAEGASETTEKSDLAGTKITFLNSKGEIQAAMEEVAGVFTISEDIINNIPSPRDTSVAVVFTPALGAIKQLQMKSVY